MKKMKSIVSVVVFAAILMAIPLGVSAAPNGRPFNDVPKNEWYYNNVYNAYTRNLFTGTEKHKFSPNQEMSRAMLVTVLYRMTGSPQAATPAGYVDVVKGSYYEAAVNWGKSVGIIDGFPDNRFAPDLSIPREQMVKILYHYYTKVLGKTPEKSSDFTGFQDGGSVSEWAKEPMRWAVGNGLVNGRTPTKLCPGDTSSRGEVATVLMRFRTSFMGDTLTDYLATTISDGDIAAYSNKKAEYWFGANYDGENRPAEPQRIQNAYGDKFNVLSIGKAEEKNIYLTFDEGYENGYTPKILDTLKAKGVQAVFFVTLDFAEKNPNLVWRMINEGHVVGNHTCAHPSAGMPSLSVEKQREDILRLQNFVRTNFGYEMTLFRYPAGIYSEQSLQLINSLGMKSVFWSFAYGDYNPKAQPKQGPALNKLLERLHPGSVYLLHAVSSTNAAILGNFIDGAYARGYNFSLVINN